MKLTQRELCQFRTLRRTIQRFVNSPESTPQHLQNLNWTLILHRLDLVIDTDRPERPNK